MGVPRSEPQALTSDQVASVALLLSKVGAMVGRRLAAALADVDLRPKHLGALSVLCAQGALSQQALGESLGMDASGVVATVDDLEREGLARRGRDEQDRRRHAVSVTPAGRSLLERAHEVTARLDEEVLAGLDERERERLTALLLRVAQGDPDLERVVEAGAIA